MSMQVIPAPLWRRLAAGLYDLLPLAALLMMGSALATGIAYLVQPTERIDLVLGQGWPHHALQLWLALLWVGYYAYSWSKGGQTIGMKAWRIELHAENGQRLGFALACLRLLLSCLSLAAVGLGFAWAIFEPRHRTWHDLLTGAVMVYRPTS